MTETDFKNRVTEALEPHRRSLVTVLQEIITHRYPAEVVSIDFEVFPDGFTAGFPVRAFFTDEANAEVFAGEAGEAKPPCPVDPGLLEIEQVYAQALENEFERDNAEADCYTLAGQALVEWFASCWRAAGGQHFKLQATIGLHDAAEVYDLVHESWRTR